MMPPRHQQTVLVVDDEPQIRKLYRVLLERDGYSVLLASDGPEALASSQAYTGQIHLLLSNIETEGMSGAELARQMIAERPGLRILFVAKPVSPSDLRRAVAAAVEGLPVGVFSCHIDEEQLELYSRNMLIEPDLGRCEEHLLVCDACRNALGETDAYISSMRRSGRKFASSAICKRWPGWSSHTVPVWSAAAAIVLAVIPLVVRQMVVRSSAPEIVNLQASRGVAGEFQATSRKPLVLNLDIFEILRQDSYLIELVTATGSRVWEKAVTVQGSEVRAPSTGLPSGGYFVRVYSSSGELLREYGLRVGGIP